MNSNYVNVFITTSTFTNKALEEANDNPSMPVITIDGKQLLQYCIEHNIGFNFKPVFSPKDIVILTQNNQVVGTITEQQQTEYLVEREITKNDIRAKILVLPRIIKEQITEAKELYTVVFNGKERQLKMDKSGRYFGGITELYKAFGLLNNDDIFVSKTAKWKISNNKIIVDLCEETNDEKKL